MLQATSFGAQPQPQTQEKKKSSIVLPVLVGAVAGGVGGAATKYGKVDKYEDVDTFVKSEDAKKELDEVKDKADDVKTLTTAIEDQKKATTANGETVKALFPDENTKEVPVGKILEKIDGKPTFEALQATVADDADKALKAKEDQLAKINEAAGKLENSKDVTIGEGDDAIKIAKDKEGKAKITIGKKGKATELDAHAKSVTDERASFAKLKDLAGKLGITKDSKLADFNVDKAKASTVLETAAQSIGENVKTAFNNVKDLLPKTASIAKISMFAGGGALVAGALAAVLGGKKE